jgi:VanZ family protein
LHPPKINAATSYIRKRRLQWWAAGVYAAFLTVVSVLPGSQLPEIPDWNLLFAPDKVAHFGAYGVFALLLSAVFTGSRIKRAILLAIFVSALYGVLMEILQGVSGTGRNFDAVDMVANLIGAILGGSLYYFLRKLKPRPSTTVGP